MKRIKLTQGKYALVDDEDFKWLNRWKWYFLSNCAGREERNKAILMHRFIMNTPQGMDTDHINRNKLDNRRSNLRICTHLQNMGNRKLNKNNKSGYKGVHWDKKINKWKAQIRRNIFLGHFDDKIKAAKAYNQKAKELFGEYANLNII